MKIKTTMYMNGSKEDSIEQFMSVCNKNKIDPSEEAIGNAMYGLMEVEISVEVDTDTGDITILGAK